MTGPLAILKLGSSVLRDEAQLFVAVDEIYSFVRRGWGVVAVTSAFAGETDRLDGRARAISRSPDSAAYACLLGAGESESAALLTLAADRAGLPASLLTPAQLGLRTRGAELDSVPDRLRTRVILRALEHGVVVVPGFLGIGAGGRPTLLGRGGSDLTALFLADRLDAAECRLVKNVDGWCEGSPASGRRYRSLHWDDAIDRPAAVVQAKASAFARDTRRPFTVAAPGSATGTRVGASRTVAEPLPLPTPPSDIVLLGLGTVGGGVYEHLRARRSEFQVKGILVRDTGRARDVDAPKSLLTEEASDLSRWPEALVVEALGGLEPAGTLVAEALRRGQSVVTANKDLLEARGAELRSLAEDSGARLLDAAAVGGACPMLEAVRSCAARAEQIHSLRGILNGTCNYLLCRLEQGVPWSVALDEARAAGLAEADPSEDVSGRDSGRKLALLGREAFGRDLSLEDIDIEGIGPEVAGDRRSRRRLVATIQLGSGDNIEARVRVETLATGDPLFGVDDAWNALSLSFADGRTTTIRGRGAGRWPTAAAVVADLLELRSDLVARGGAAPSLRAEVA